MLKRIADAIGRRIRAQDTVGRYGGEEFVVILPDTSEAGGMRVARDLCERVGALAINADRVSVHVTLSIGVHGGVVSQELTAAGLIRAADDALYRAKRLGRNRVEGSETHGEGLLVGA